MVGNEPGHLYLSFIIMENYLELACALVLDPAKEWLESLAPTSFQEPISFSVIPLTGSLICLGGCFVLFTCSFSLTWKVEESHKHRCELYLLPSGWFVIRLPSGWFVSPVLGIYTMCTSKQSLTLPSKERVIGREESHAQCLSRGLPCPLFSVAQFKQEEKIGRARFKLASSGRHCLPWALTKMQTIVLPPDATMQCVIAGS